MSYNDDELLVEERSFKSSSEDDDTLGEDLDETLDIEEPLDDFGFEEEDPEKDS